MQDKISTRSAFGEALQEIGAKKNIFVLDSDVSKSTYSNKFARKYPERFFNMGIAEGNMLGVAAGIASCGNIVFACSFAIFTALRACEQIRNSICYPNLDVKIIGTHSGLSAGKDGATHQALEDVAIMRSFPNMTVICPCDAVQTKAAVKFAAKLKGPVYIRLRRSDESVIYDKGAPYEIGKANILKKGSDVALIASGSAVCLALGAAAMLGEKGISAMVVDMHTIKPLDAGTVVCAARAAGAIVTCEEHSILGGLGSAVAETTAKSCPVPIRYVGVADVFGKSGGWEELKEKHGITAENICDKAIEAVKAKEYKVLGRNEHETL